MFSNFGELERYCKEQGVKMIDFKLIDLSGRWRHITIPIERLAPSLMEDGIGFDGSNYGFASVESSDMVFVPDLSTAMMDPFWEMPTLSLIGDVISLHDHKPFTHYPRAIAKASEKYLATTGIADRCLLGPEFEFYLFDRVAFDLQPHSTSMQIETAQARWTSGDNFNNNGYQINHKGGYHITPPMDTSHDYRNEVTRMLEERGVPIKYHHHEVGGPGQLELEVESGPLTVMADRSMLIKYFIRNSAAAWGKTATFLPKPLYGEAGSGMHVHFWLFKGQEPLFFDPAGYSSLSKTALYSIGGILKHTPALLGLTNPSTNSYRRLIPGYEAPVSICYATSNRSAVIRVPGYAKTPANKRFEFRSSDATCNPYLAYAGILMAAIDGIKNKIDPVAEGFGPYDINIFELPPAERDKIKSLPHNVEEALNALAADHAFLTTGGVFPEKLIEKWIETKLAESRQIDARPNPYEVATYYDL
ncbi:MAG TPA: type I glutamate--ammonia ligase [Firmicutes bacterium]|nr:type I glutamate--ammonia ligase [Bacillota bacterium]HAZ22480.1 type I glutamate--ammonia ligase [Bacillota bacterium]HBE06195.1 type I glutamate--ammonia ligase [Bacillota bacterium]HBG45146.1 type I glutamate--ammonia ligase [Bacillota bacterium]HBL50642.1 type I glutamate--ammonia ligase [Bacillota bacterium]